MEKGIGNSSDAAAFFGVGPVRCIGLSHRAIEYDRRKSKWR